MTSPTSSDPTPSDPDSPTSRPLAGRSALVTGASRGIGFAIAAELSRRGATVVITGRKPDALAEAAEQLSAQVPGAAVVASPGNVGDPDHRAQAVATAVDLGGGIDIVINNTGINPAFGQLLDADLSAVRKIFDTNVVAALGIVQEACRAGMTDSGGSIVNIASVAGLRSTGVIAAYGASKAALIRLTEELAWELGRFGIRVNAVAPGIVKTRFAEALVAGGNEERAVEGYPLGRLGEPADVARAVAFLADDEASWITGETMRVEGGLLSTGSM